MSEKINLDIDPEELSRQLSVREQVGVYLLLMVFAIVFPLKYSHQLNKLWDEIRALNR